MGGKVEATELPAQERQVLSPSALLLNGLQHVAIIAPIGLVFPLLVLRAGQMGAWRKPMPIEVSTWVVRGWLANIGVMALALAVAAWVPVAGLVIAALSGTSVGIMMALIAPPAYRHWA